MQAALLLAMIVIPPRVEVGEGGVHAAQLVTGEVIGVRELKALRGVGLGQAPAAGQVRRISGAYLKRLLRAAGLRRVSVPDQVELVGRSATVTAGEQLKRIESYLREEIGKRGEITSVAGYRNLEDATVPVGARILRVRPVGQNPFAARVTFKLDIGRRGRVVMTRYPQVTVEGRAAVWVTTRDLRMRQKISAADVRREDQELSSLRPEMLRRLSPVGRLAARHLRAGTALAARDLRMPAVVKRGQRVRISVRHATVRVVTAGEALANGAVGDIVRVKNISSGRQLRGTVRGPGLVEITP